MEKFKFSNQIATMTDAEILGSVISKFVSPDINLSPNPVWKDDAKTMECLVALLSSVLERLRPDAVRRARDGGAG